MTGEGITDEGLMGLFEPVDKTSARFWQDELVLLASVFCCCCLLNLNDHDRYLQTFVSSNNTSSYSEARREEGLTGKGLLLLLLLLLDSCMRFPN